MSDGKWCDCRISQCDERMVKAMRTKVRMVEEIIRHNKAETAVHDSWYLNLFLFVCLFFCFCFVFFFKRVFHSYHLRLGAVCLSPVTY